MTLMKSKDLARKIASAAAMIGVLPLAGLCALVGPAAGADFDFGQPFPGLAAPAPREDMVEFASNWYVRGDLAYAQETFPKKPFPMYPHLRLAPRRPRSTHIAPTSGGTRSTIGSGRI